MSLYQPGSHQILEGQAEVTVDVYDVDAGPGEPKYNYVHPFQYPKNTGIIGPSWQPVNRFKHEYLEHLAAELCMKHITHKEVPGIADDR